MTTLTSLGCNRPDSNPEFHDPIYTRITAEVTELEKIAEETEKKIEKLEIEFQKTEPRTLERKNSKKDILAAKVKLKKANQMAEYLKIRAIRRKYYDKVEYLKAYETKTDWPPKREFAAYETNGRLQRASRNWDDRVPRSKSQQSKVEIRDPATIEDKKDSK